MPDRLPTLAEVRLKRTGLNVCVVCKNDIHIMCRKYTGICSENCQKLANLPVNIKETPNA